MNSIFCLPNSPVHHPLILFKTPERLYSSTVPRSQISFTWRTSEGRTTKPVLFGYGRPGAYKAHIKYEPPKPPNSLHPNSKKQQSSLVIDTLLNGDGMIIAYVYSSTVTLAPGMCSLRALSWDQSLGRLPEHWQKSQMGTRGI